MRAWNSILQQYTNSRQISSRKNRKIPKTTTPSIRISPRNNQTEKSESKQQQLLLILNKKLTYPHKRIVKVFTRVGWFCGRGGDGGVSATCFCQVGWTSQVCHVWYIWWLVGWLLGGWLWGVFQREQGKWGWVVVRWEVGGLVRQRVTAGLRGSELFLHWTGKKLEKDLVDTRYITIPREF